MSRKAASAVIGSFLAAGFALGAVQGCGSSSSSTPSCSEICVKEAMCQADASTASAATLCNLICAQGAAGASGQGTKCTNASAMSQAFNKCFSVSDCPAFNSCVNDVPPCQTGAGGTSATGGISGTGTGGTTSTGGASGTGTGGVSGAAGGSGTTAGCSVCDKAQTCCIQGAPILNQPTSDCSFSTAACNAMSSSAQSAYATGCQTVLTDGALLSVSACK